MRNYNRSTHNLSKLWRSSMSAGTLVPFMSKLALPGDTWDIDLNCEVLTLPTIGPLFGSYKVQLDVFQVPMRLYNSFLHQNRTKIGNNMSQIKIPQYKVEVDNESEFANDDNGQVSSSALIKYLGVSGIGHVGTEEPHIRERFFNAIPMLGYWDIYKQYYSNKQEERGFVIHAADVASMTPSQVTLTANSGSLVRQILNSAQSADIDATSTLTINLGS